MMQITSSKNMKWIMSEPTATTTPELYIAAEFYTLFALIALLIFR